MRLRRQARMKFLAHALSGGVVFQVAQNCTIFNGQLAATAINWTWFLTCNTDTLFSGYGLLLDCDTVDANPTSSTDTSSTDTSSSTSGLDLSGLSGLLGT